MPIEVHWGDETHAYINYRLTDPWDWDHFHSACQYGRRLADEAVDKICIIFDFTGTAHLPRGALAQLQKTAVTPHPKTRVRFIVGKNPLIAAIVNTIQRLYPKATKSLILVGTREEAINHIRRLHMEVEARN